MTSARLAAHTESDLDSHVPIIVLVDEENGPRLKPHPTASALSRQLWRVVLRPSGHDTRQARVTQHVDGQSCAAGRDFPLNEGRDETDDVLRAPSP